MATVFSRFILVMMFDSLISCPRLICPDLICARFFGVIGLKNKKVSGFFTLKFGCKTEFSLVKKVQQLSVDRLSGEGCNIRFEF